MEKMLNDVSVKRELRNLVDKERNLNNQLLDSLKSVQKTPNPNRTNFSLFKNQVNDNGINHNISYLERNSSYDGVEVDGVVSPSAVTKHMLYNCKVMRKRNINVVPISRQKNLDNSLFTKTTSYKLGRLTPIPS